MGSLVSDILLRIAGTNDDARRALREIAEEVVVFNQTEAKVHVEADVANAKQQLRAILLERDALSREEAAIRVDIDGAEKAKTRLKEIAAERDAIGRKKTDIRIAVNDVDAKAKIKSIDQDLIKNRRAQLDARAVIAADTDEVAVKAARAALKKLDQERAELSYRKTVIRVSVDDVSATKAMKDLDRRVADLRDEEARIKPAAANGGAATSRLAALGSRQTDLDAREAGVRASIAALLADPPSAEVRIKADPKAALASIAEIDAALSLVAKRDVSANVRVDIDAARARLRILRAEMDHALKGGVGSRAVAEIAKDIAAVGGAVASMGAELTTLGAKAAGAFATIGSGIAQVGASLLASVAGGLVTIAASVALVAVAAAVLVPIIVALAGALGALVASLAAAVAGFGALLVGGLFAAVPVIGLVVFGITRLIGATKALKDAEDNRIQTARQLRDAEEAHEQALRAKQDAVANLAKAEEDAADAERDALLGVRDARLQLEASKLGITGADIGLERAKQKLEEVRDAAKEAGPAFGDLLKKFEDVDVNTDKGTVEDLVSKVSGLPGGTDHELDVKEALLGVANAQLNVKEAKLRDERATNALSDAVEKNNEFVRDGIRAYQPYVQTLRSVEAADRGLRDTAQRTNDVRVQAQKETKKYSEGELSAGRAVLAIGTQIKKILQPAAGPATKGILGLLEGVADLLSDGGIQDGMEEIGEAVGEVTDGFGDLLETHEVKDTFAGITKEGAKMVRILGGDVFRDFFIILLRIARVAGPELVDLLKDFSRFFGRVRKGTDDIDGLRGGVRGVVRSFRDWLGLARQLARVVLNFFRGGKEEGDNLVRTITRILKRWADFLGTEEGQKKIKAFLKKAVEDTKGFLGFLQDAYEIMKKMVDVVNTLGRALKNTFGAIKNSVFGRAVQGVAGAAGSLAGGGSLKDAAGALIHPNDFGDDDDKKRKKGRGRAMGGLVDWPSGSGGDNILQPLRGGEFVLKNDVVAGIGLPALNALNSGASLGSVAPREQRGGGDMIIEKQDVILPPAANGGPGDPRDAAAKFGEEMRRRGKGR